MTVGTLLVVSASGISIVPRPQSPSTTNPESASHTVKLPYTLNGTIALSPSALFAASTSSDLLSIDYQNGFETVPLLSAPASSATADTSPISAIVPCSEGSDDIFVARAAKVFRCVAEGHKMEIISTVPAGAIHHMIFGLSNTTLFVHSRAPDSSLYMFNLATRTWKPLFLSPSPPAGTRGKRSKPPVPNIVSLQFVKEALLVLTADALLVYGDTKKSDRPSRTISLASFRCIALAKSESSEKPLGVVIVVAEGGHLLLVDLASKTSPVSVKSVNAGVCTALIVEKERVPSIVLGTNDGKSGLVLEASLQSLLQDPTPEISVLASLNDSEPVLSLAYSPLLIKPNFPEPVQITDTANVVGHRTKKTRIASRESNAAKDPKTFVQSLQAHLPVLVSAGRADPEGRKVSDTFERVFLGGGDSGAEGDGSLVGVGGRGAGAGTGALTGGGSIVEKRLAMFEPGHRRLRSKEQRDDLEPSSLITTSPGYVALDVPGVDHDEDDHSPLGQLAMRRRAERRSRDLGTFLSGPSDGTAATSRALESLTTGTPKRTGLMDRSYPNSSSPRPPVPNIVTSRPHIGFGIAAASTVASASPPRLSYTPKGSPIPLRSGRPSPSPSPLAASPRSGSVHARFSGESPRAHPGPSRMRSSISAATRARFGLDAYIGGSSPSVGKLAHVAEEEDQPYSMRKTTSATSLDGIAKAYSVDGGTPRVPRSRLRETTNTGSYVSSEETKRTRGMSDTRVNSQISNVLEDMRFETREMLVGMHVDLLKAGMRWKREIKAQIEESVRGQLSALYFENLRLKAENANLRG